MKNGSDTLATALTGGFLSSLAYLVGGIDNLFIAFGIFMACDYATGMIAGGREKKVSSKRAFKGLGKKTGMLVFIIISNQLDVITGNSNGFLRNLMIFFLIGTEGISILENLGRIGLPIPEFIESTLSRMKGKPREPEENK